MSYSNSLSLEEGSGKAGPPEAHMSQQERHPHILTGDLSMKTLYLRLSQLSQLFLALLIFALGYVFLRSLFLSFLFPSLFKFLG